MNNENIDLIIDKINKIPNADKFENNKLKNLSNWFSKCLVLLLTIIGIGLGIIIILLIDYFLK